MGEASNVEATNETTVCIEDSVTQMTPDTAQVKSPKLWILLISNNGKRKWRNFRGKEGGASMSAKHKMFIRESRVPKYKNLQTPIKSEREL